MKIDALVVSNLRTFSDRHTLVFHDSLTVIVGKNNTGKSTLLEAMYSLGAANERDDRVNLLARTGATGEAWLKLHVDLGEFEKQYEPFAAQFYHLTNTSASGVLTVLDSGGELIEIASENGGAVRMRNGGVVAAFRSPNWGKADSPSTEPWQRLFGFLRKHMGNSIAYWSHFGVKAHTWDHKKRVLGSTEDRLRSAFTFLRLNHPRHFEKLEATIVATLPEFLGVTFHEGNLDVYDPRLSLRNKADVSRAQFGAGAWAFICVLAAAHVAFVTGAKVLLLDEPTLFMHPTLERKLLAVLRDPSYWDGAPLRLVVASHSPFLADMAFREGGLRVVDWENRQEARVVIRMPQKPGHNSSVAPSEIVHGAPLVFVEGASDKAALDKLSRETALPCTVVPLNVTDLFLKPGGIAVLAGAAGDGFVGGSRVLLDLDKKHMVEKAREKTHASEQPTFYFAGTATGQDLESCFCSFEFLADFAETWIKKHGIEPAANWKDELRTHLDKLASSPTHKGDRVVEWLFKKVLNEADSKPTFTALLADHALELRNSPKAAEVWTNLEPVLKALDATILEPST